MKSNLLGLSIVVIATYANPAFATKADYCAAYARDFADIQTQDKTLWQHKYDIAKDECLAEPKAAAQVIRIKSKSTPKTTSSIAVVPAEPLSTPAPANAKQKLEPGTDDWNNYCANKYTSFSAKTGTYTSHTGVERKCVVSYP